jgi:hypothetical protein
MKYYKLPNTETCGWTGTEKCLCDKLSLKLLWGFIPYKIYKFPKYAHFNKFILERGNEWLIVDSFSDNPNSGYLSGFKTLQINE